MLAKQFMSFGALLCMAGAQTAPGFPISASSTLAVAYGNNTVSPPGELIPRGETAQPPSFSSSTWPSNAGGPIRGVLLMVDSDVPRNGSRVQLIHWIGSNVTLSSSNALVVGSSPVPYLQPSPPVGDVPHSYTFIVFAQPANFSIPAQYADLAQTRVNFNTSQFVSDTGLRDVIGANYIRVQNLTGSATTTFPPARPTASGAGTTSAPAAFPGGAQPLVVGGAKVWAGLLIALLSGVAAVVL